MKNPCPLRLPSRPETRLLSAALCLTLIVSLALPSLAQVPVVFSDPEDGGEFSEMLTLTFLEEMRDTIAIEFQGAGGVAFDCAWQTFGGLIPNQILECVPRSPLPAGNTVTWTINPTGTGFTTVSGSILPTTSGTFHVPAGSGGVTVTPTPGNGEIYDPILDGPVRFEFSEAMDTTLDPDTGISFNLGTWSCTWADVMTIQCTLQGTPEPGDYSYTLSGFETLGAAVVDDFTGSFTIAGSSVELTMTPFPANLASYNPQTDGPVTFTFSKAMDQTVNPQIAVMFTLGTWTRVWANATTVACTPTAALAAGTYNYFLSGFESIDQEPLPFTTGSFVVSGGGGNNDGTPAPDCPAQLQTLPLPKTLAVCGATFFAWDEATVRTATAGSAFLLDGWSALGQQSLPSLAVLNAQGAITATVVPEEPGTDLAIAADPTRVLASRLTTNPTRLQLGVFQLDAALQPIFQLGLDVADSRSQVDPLSDGRITVVEDLGTRIQVTLLTSSGSQAWSRQYSAAGFGAAAGGIPGLGGGQTVSLRELSPGFLLDVSQSAASLNGSAIQFKSTNILVRLASDGAVQWAKKYTGVDTYPGPHVVGTTGGNLYLQAFGVVDPEAENPIARSDIFRLDADGKVVWGTRITGATLSVISELPGGKVLLGGGMSDTQSESSTSVFAALGATGSLETQVQLGLLADNYTTAAVDGDRIYYTLSAAASSSPSSPRTIAIGSSSLQLESWIWRQYAQPADSALLLPAPGGSLVFSAFHRNDHNVDVVSLNDALQPDATCALFAEVAVSATPSTLNSTASSLTVAAETVTATQATKTTATGNVGLQAFTIAESALCNTGGNPAAVRLAPSLGASGEAVVQFTTETGVDYTVYRATRLLPADWTPVESLPGTGSPITRSYARNPGIHTYLRIVAQRP